jgi:lipopolysaccharide exporter
MPDQPLMRRTARGMAWAYGSFVGGRVLVFVTTAILARVLSPEDFGLVALALAFTVFLDMLKDLGVSEALVIASDEDLDRRAQTAFAIMLGVGGVLFLLTIGLGPLAASFYDEDELTLMLPVLGLTFLLRSLSGTQYAIAQRAMDFQTRTSAELADVILRGIVGISLALAGAGAWSLVAGYVAGAAAHSVTLWLRVDWRPRLGAGSRGDVRALLTFGGALTGVTIASAIVANVDRLIIGRVLGAAQLGLFTLASRLPELFIVNLSYVAGQVLFPAFASADRDRLRPAFVASLGYAAMVALPLGAFLGTLAEPLLVAAFGDQWRGASDVMLVFCIASVSAPITFVAGTVLKARGRAGLLLRVSILQVIIQIPTVAIVASDGILAVAIADAVIAGIVLVLQLTLAMRLLAVSLTAVLGALAPPALGAAAVIGVCLGVDALFDADWPTILVAGLGSLVVYLAIMWTLAREALRRLLGAFLPSAAPETA